MPDVLEPSTQGKSVQVVGVQVARADEIVVRIQNPVVLTAVDGSGVHHLEPVQGGIAGPLEAELLELLSALGVILDVNAFLPDCVELRERLGLGVSRYCSGIAQTSLRHHSGIAQASLQEYGCGGSGGGNGRAHLLAKLEPTKLDRPTILSIHGHDKTLRNLQSPTVAIDPNLVLPRRVHCHLKLMLALVEVPHESQAV